jgi:hypothetical protein
MSRFCLWDSTARVEAVEMPSQEISNTVQIEERTGVYLCRQALRILAGRCDVVQF